jgi:hypothetical protein
MRRQLVASGAAVTTALAVGLALPAFGTEPENPGGNITCEDLESEGLIEGVIESIKVDSPSDEVNQFFAADVHTDNTLLDVFVAEGYVILAVIVKGGDDSSVYLEEPFVDLSAPEVGQGNTPEISHYEVCIGKEKDDEDNGDKDNGDKDEEEPAKPTTPAPVPTEVPAGASDGSGGSPALLGLALAGTAAVAGAAVVARRRFLHDS